MKIKIAAALFAAGLFLATPLQARPDQIRKKQSELQKLKTEISAFETKIRDKEKKEKATLDLLDSYDRQSLLLKKLIRGLKEQATGLAGEIDTTRRTIAMLSGRMQYLRDNYASHIVAAYKSGRSGDLELLLASASLNQLLVRQEYLRRFADQRRRDIDHIGLQKDEMESQRDALQRQLGEQQELLREKGSEEQLLARKMKKRQALLTTIRKDKKNFQRELTRKMESAKEMEKLISRLIDEDRDRKNQDAVRSDKAPSSPESESAAGVSFAARRGALRWPVTSGRVVSRFGSQENPSLHTVTQNTGIDIAVPGGTSVEAVAAGEVSVISWLPSFGNLVILNHKNGYRTVYAHLSEIDVKEGESVREGERLGESGEALTGPLLHFEIYKDREKLDPEQWLRQRGLSQR
jgi:septal ring factor EnvC (AmiA/AmiB activator)